MEMALTLLVEVRCGKRANLASYQLASTRFDRMPSPD